MAISVRVLRYPRDFLAEFRHPVAGSFVPTLPIAFILVAIDFLTLGGVLFGETASLAIASWLLALGGIGIWGFGLASLSSLFIGTEARIQHATFGWLIPPVSQMIIAVGGLELARHMGQGTWTDAVILVSIMGLGIGSVLFLLVGALVYQRYTLAEQPGPRMAPTAAIGFAPTSVLVIALAKLLAAGDAASWASKSQEWTGLLHPLAIGLWGFSAFGLALAIIIIASNFKSMRASFGLTWWAMVFPLGAFTVATGALGRMLSTALLEPVLLGLDLALLMIWALVLLGTLRGMANGSIYARD